MGSFGHIFESRPMGVRVENEPNVRIIPIIETGGDVFSSRSLATINEETPTEGALIGSESQTIEQLWEKLCVGNSVYVEFMTKLIQTVQHADMKECKIPIGLQPVRIGMYP